MSKYYEDYIWKNGMPYGVKPKSEALPAGITYKVISDPYHKRISIEKYSEGNFTEVIYDSALFDFRHLQPARQTAWQKSSISDTVCHIRDQDDRLILIEKYLFEGQRCRECRASSPCGLLISIQKIYYVDCQDPFNGVILFDSNQHQVLIKRYQIDSASMEFTDLLEESWEPKTTP